VLEIVQQPGVEGAPHSHRAAVVYAVEGAHVSHTAKDGQPAEQTLKPAAAVAIPAVANHTMKNLGASPTKLIMFELL
jgi:quercetin dioxygenase-like cupin family protein